MEPPVESGQAAPFRHAPETDLSAAIVEAAGILLVSVGLDGRILAWNQATSRLFGWSDDDEPRTVYDISPEDEWESIRSNHERAAQGETLGPVEVERFYAGRTMFLEVLVVPIREADGRIRAIANVARDITAEVKVRRERSRLEEQLREAQRLEATGRLAGGIAHDFNNLLTAIQGYGAELLAELPSGTPGHDSAAQILRSSEQASELIHQLLAFARRQVLRPEVVDLNALIASQVTVLRRVLGASVAVAVDPSPEPALVAADRGQLAEVIAHLVLNARDAMPEGGAVHLSTRIAPASEGLASVPGADADTARAGANEVVLRVADTGDGIPADALPHIFEPFFTTKEMGRGTGMGLAMVHGVVRQSGGRIEVATGPAGTTMTVYLPLATRSSAATPGRAAERPAATSRVLVVDDDAIVRSVARRILDTAGYEVIEAADAGQARAIIEADSGPVHLLLTDVIMPGMRGPDLARLLREVRPGLPVVFMSGYAGEDAGLGAIGEAAAFLAKPFTAPDLIAAVASLVGPPLEDPPRNT